MIKKHKKWIGFSIIFLTILLFWCANEFGNLGWRWNADRNKIYYLLMLLVVVFVLVWIFTNKFEITEQEVYMRIITKALSHLRKNNYNEFFTQIDKAIDILKENKKTIQKVKDLYDIESIEIK